jgi:hypothetical protein
MIDPNFSIRQQEIIYQDIQRRNTRPSNGNNTSQTNLVPPNEEGIVPQPLSGQEVSAF